MSNPTRSFICTFVLALSCLSGCQEDEPAPDPMIGAWQSRDSVAGQRNALEVRPDLRGEATIWFYYAEELYYADFDVRVSVIEKGARYELEMECDGCADFDFDMECDMVYDDRLECDGDGPWESYAFEWERD